VSPIKKSQQAIKVNGAEIRYNIVNGEDYISLTDMAKHFGGERAIYSWLRVQPTIEFLGTWEVINNPSFKPHEFVRFKNESGSNRFNPTPKQWIEATGAIGMTVKAGRYGGGTNAHRDIAFEFASHLSAEFKLYLIKEFQRLKVLEASHEQWDIRRFLSKAAYKMQTKAIYGVLQTDGASMSALQKKLLYASEADLLNVLVFGQTASEWKKASPALAKSSSNQRDYASAKQLLIITHLESINANMINRKIEKAERIRVLAKKQSANRTVLTR
jgi:hypothetical protein